MHLQVRNYISSFLFLSHAEKPSQASMARRRELGTLGILREALLTFLKNGKLMGSTMLMLITLNLLGLMISKVIPPLVVDVTSIVHLLPSKFTISKSRQVEVKIWPLNFIISMFSMSVVVYLSVMAHTSRQLGLKELSSKIRRTCWGFVITLSCVRVVTIMYTTLFSMFATFVKLFAASSSGSLLMLLVLAIMFVVSSVISLYLFIAGDLSLVVSLVEEGRQGFGALRRAGGLMGGRKLKSFVLMVVFMLLKAALSTALGHWKRSQPKKRLMAVDVVQDLSLLVAADLFGIFHRLACTVYYYECKRNHGRGKAVGEERMYNLVPFTSNTDVALP